MRRRSVLAGLASLPLPRHASAEAPPLPVIASFSILGDLTAAVAGPLGRVEMLVGPDQDVHVYEPRPHDLRMLAASRLLVRNGLGLEGWMDRLIQASGFKGRTISAADRITPRTIQEGGAMATDPHAWQDPRNAITYVQAIATGLSQADPGNANAYAANAARLAEAIRQMDAWIEAAFNPIPPNQRRIITTHDAFGYYGARYGIAFLSAEGISTEAEPSARAIATLIAQIRREKVRAVFIEAMTSGRMARMLASETGAVLGGTVYSDALSAQDGPAPTYLSMLRHNTTLFAAAMKGA